MAWWRRGGPWRIGGDIGTGDGRVWIDGWGVHGNEGWRGMGVVGGEMRLESGWYRGVSLRGRGVLSVSVSVHLSLFIFACCLRKVITLFWWWEMSLLASVYYRFLSFEHTSFLSPYFTQRFQVSLRCSTRYYRWSWTRIASTPALRTKAYVALESRTIVLLEWKSIILFLMGKCFSNTSWCLGLFLFLFLGCLNTSLETQILPPWNLNFSGSSIPFDLDHTTRGVRLSPGRNLAIRSCCNQLKCSRVALRLIAYLSDLNFVLAITSEAQEQ